MPQEPPDTAALFVRIPAAEAEKLDRAAFELKVPKQELVSGLVSRYVDPSPDGLAKLRRITVETADDSLTVGRHWFAPADPDEVLTIAQVADLLQAEEKVVAELARGGELPGRKVGKEWRFVRRAVLEWLAGGED
jgi:excisionase family DNA binding protein